MNYQRIYSSLIVKAKERGLCEGYFEVHHVTPKCMGGDDQPDNLVRLTPEEHYLAHQLLTKIHPNNQKLLYAAMCMANFRCSNKLYGWLRRKWAKHQSLKMLGDTNPSKGTRVIHNPELRKTSRIPKGEDLPEGWQDGGVYN
jgi:hypothetical protein